jgi:hypothetical protein
MNYSIPWALWRSNAPLKPDFALTHVVVVAFHLFLAPCFLVSFPSGMRVGRSVEDATFIGGHHVLDVNEGVFTAMLLEELKGALDEVSQDHSLTLAILDLVSKVQVVALEEVKDGEDLSVVGYKGLSNSLRALDERLEDLKGHSDNLRVTGVKGSYE